jgi:hypothetical protein
MFFRPFVRSIVYFLYIRSLGQPFFCSFFCSSVRPTVLSFIFTSVHPFVCQFDRSFIPICMFDKFECYKDPFVRSYVCPSSSFVYLAVQLGPNHHSISSFIRLWFNKFFRLFVSPFVCSIISSVIYASCMHIRSFVRLFIRLLFNSIVCMFIRITIYDRTDQMRRRIIIRNSHIPVSISLTVYISIPSFDYPFV